ncbi:MAG: hypothetical protein IPN38_17265 [Flavobacteriales bacterium]|nr:hypothetical protein [Flavobacteriales bacterium]
MNCHLLQRTVFAQVEHRAHNGPVRSTGNELGAAAPEDLGLQVDSRSFRFDIPVTHVHSELQRTGSSLIGRGSGLADGETRPVASM